MTITGPFNPSALLLIWQNGDKDQALIIKPMFLDSNDGKQVREIKSSPGHFQMVYYDLRNRQQMLKINLPDMKKRKNKLSFKLWNGCYVDLAR